MVRGPSVSLSVRVEAAHGDVVPAQTLPSRAHPSATGPPRPPAPAPSDHALLLRDLGADSAPKRENPRPCLQKGGRDSPTRPAQETRTPSGVSSPWNQAESLLGLRLLAARSRACRETLCSGGHAGGGRCTQRTPFEPGMKHVCSIYADGILRFYVSMKPRQQAREPTPPRWPLHCGRCVAPFCTLCGTERIERAEGGVCIGED